MFLALMALLSTAFAASQMHVSITFLPPPMERATISLGVFDAKGKLIRVLRSEATEKDFRIALNGFVVDWNGHDDAGKTVPHGEYRVRGYAVRPPVVEGIASLGNDWLDEDYLPRIKHLQSISLMQSGEIQLNCRIVDGKVGLYAFNDDAGTWRLPGPMEMFSGGSVPHATILADSLNIEAIAGLKQADILVHRGQAWRVEMGKPEKIELGLPSDSVIVDITKSRSHGWWLIVKSMTTAALELVELDAENKPRRAMDLSLPPGVSDVRILADQELDRLFLHESGPKFSRFRVLELESAEATPKPADDTPASPATETPSESEPPTESIWKEIYSRAITNCDTYEAAHAAFPELAGSAQVPSISIALGHNPLERKGAKRLDVTVACDAKGTVLKSLDGLPLARLTEREYLQWATMATDSQTSESPVAKAGAKTGRSVRLIQSDQAVVEVFEVRNFSSIVPFDAGEYEWPPE